MPYLDTAGTVHSRRVVEQRLHLLLGFYQLLILRLPQQRHVLRMAVHGSDVVLRAHINIANMLF